MDELSFCTVQQKNMAENLTRSFQQNEKKILLQATHRFCAYYCRSDADLRSRMINDIDEFLCAYVRLVCRLLVFLLQFGLVGLYILQCYYFGKVI